MWRVCECWREELTLVVGELHDDTAEYAAGGGSAGHTPPHGSRRVPPTYVLLIFFGYVLLLVRSLVDASLRVGGWAP